jgi:hypothetical protein
VFVGIVLRNLDLISLCPEGMGRETPQKERQIRMATQTETQRKTAARKAAATRRRNAAKRGQSATRSAATRTQTSAARTAETAAQTAETRARAEASALRAVQSQAERAVLIPVGAALVARDAVVDATKPFTASRESAEKELERVGNRVAVNLRKFERRGSTARNRAVREVKRTRTRVEREVRTTRREFERQVKATRREVQSQAETFVSRVGSLA